MSAFIPAHVSGFTARILRTVVIALVLFSCSIASAQRDVRVEESVRAAAPTAAQLDEIERSILPLRHGYDRHEALAAFAAQEGATRDDMSAALVAVIERRPPSTNRVDAIREFAIAELAIFGGTNALPALRRLALDPDEPNAREAVGSYYAIAGFAPESLAWAEGFLVNAKPEDATRRSLFLSIFRHAFARDDLAPAERNALGRCLLRVTEASDDSPAWTDQVLCRAFPAYIGSAERRARLEAARARRARPPPRLRLQRPRDRRRHQRRALRNPRPPLPARPPRPSGRIRPPRNPAGVEAMMSMPQAQRSYGMWQ